MSLTVRYGISDDIKKLFLQVPKLLYKNSRRVQNVKEEKAILDERHVLSHYFTILPVVILDDDKPVGRCLVTLYPNEDVCYIGYFESAGAEIARLIFQTVDSIADRLKRTVIRGTVDASFWIRYRVKLNHFERPYSCEPYNKPDYSGYFEDYGYHVSDVYYSNYA